MNELNIRNKSCRLGLIGARKNMGYSQARLAKLANMSRSQLAAMEIGLRNANDDTWKILKKLLRVKSVEEIWEIYTYKDGWFIGDDGSKIKDMLYDNRQNNKDKVVDYE